MLNGNRLSSYFLYAFGEIVLVVLGILIALQVNEWNEERTRDRERREFYLALESDIETIQKLLEDAKRQSVKGNYRIESFLNAAGTNPRLFPIYGLNTGQVVLLTLFL